MLLGIQSTVNLIMNKELVKGIRNACGRVFRFHCNSEKMIIRAEATLPGFGIIWFDNRCTANILYLSKAKNMYRVMYDGSEGNQFIMVMPKREVLSNDIHNGIYYNDLEDRDLAVVNRAVEIR